MPRALKLFVLMLIIVLGLIALKDGVRGVGFALGAWAGIVVYIGGTIVVLAAAAWFVVWCFRKPAR